MLLAPASPAQYTSRWRVSGKGGNSSCAQYIPIPCSAGFLKGIGLEPMRKLLAVDPSLTCSGWALFLLTDGGLKAPVLKGVGKVRSLPPKHALSFRLVDLQAKVKSILESIDLGANDVLVCEAQTTMRDPHAAFKVEQVRCIFETIARDRSVSVPGRLNPRSVQHEVMGLRGQQLGRKIVKDTAVAVAQVLFAADLKALGFATDTKHLSKHQDIVDALLLGALAASKLREGVWADAAMDFSMAPRALRVGKRLLR